MYGEKRVHPACTKASNPYHECNENCLKRISGAGGGGEINQPGFPLFSILLFCQRPINFL